MQIGQLPPWLRQMARCRWEAAKQKRDDARSKGTRTSGGRTTEDDDVQRGAPSHDDVQRRRAQDLGRQRGNRPQKRRLTPASGRGTGIDERLQQTGHAWLVDMSIEHDMREHERACAIHENESGREKRARGLPSLSLLPRQGDG